MLVPLTLALVLGLFVIAGAQAVHDDGLFELDKNATNDLSTSKLGVLQANIDEDDSPIVVCELADAHASPPSTPFDILVEAEEIEVTARADVAGGAGGCSTKASYTVTRGTNNVSHQKADDVTLLVEVTKPGPDWDQVFEQVSLDGNDTGDDDKCIALGLLECAYVNDGAGATIFEQDSKDHIDIPGWKHKSGNVSDKSNLLNAYAAKDVAGDGHQILYFGADRVAVDGSTDAGFWFFKDEVIANPDGTFTGEHEVGDILILTTFTQGGATNTVRVFQWVGSGGNESGTIQGPDATFGDCVPGSGGDNGCATVNDTSILVPWDHTSKGEPAGGWVPAGGLLEGAVDLTALNLEGCFTSFLAETRSSPSVPAVLEDFVLGKFEACGSTLTTTPKTGAGGSLTADSDNDNLDEISIGAGSVTVTDSALLSVTGTTTFTGTLAFFICGPIAAPATCDTGGVPSGSSTVTTNGTYPSTAATLTSVGRYCWRSTFTSGTTGVPNASDSRAESAGPPKSTGECFEVMPVTPTLDTDAGDGPVDFGQAVTDTATLAGTAKKPGTDGPNVTYPSINPVLANQAVAGGTITFRLYGPFSSGTPTAEQCATIGLAAGFAAAHPDGIQRAVSGNGPYPTASQAAVSYTPTAPGWYFWKASYGGDSPNTNASGEHNTTCQDTDEAVLVSQVPTSTTTRQFVFPQDKAVITATTGTLAGNLRFTLHDSLAECQSRSDIKYDSGNIAISGASPQSGATNNQSYRIVDGTTHYWNVSYASTNTAQLGSSSVCTETTTVTYAGNDSGISIP
jgi:hypothetical protein